MYMTDTLSSPTAAGARCTVRGRAIAWLYRRSLLTFKEPGPPYDTFENGGLKDTGVKGPGKLDPGRK